MQCSVVYLFSTFQCLFFYWFRLVADVCCVMAVALAVGALLSTTERRASVLNCFCAKFIYASTAHSLKILSAVQSSRLLFSPHVSIAMRFVIILLNVTTITLAFVCHTRCLWQNIKTAALTCALYQLYKYNTHCSDLALASTVLCCCFVALFFLLIKLLVSTL